MSASVAPSLRQPAARPSNSPPRPPAPRLLLLLQFLAVGLALPGCVREPPAPELTVASQWVHVGTTWIWAATPEALVDGVPADARALVLETRDAEAGELAVRGAVRPLRPLVGGPPVGSANTESTPAAPASLVVHPRRGPAPRQPQLRLFVVADTLRADVAEEEMVELQAAFASPGGRRLTSAFAPATWTLPSMASLFVGRPPSSLRAADGALIAVPEGAGTVAARARQRGFATAAIVANPTLGHENGFSQGFDLYDVPTYLEGWRIPDATEVADKALQVVRWLQGEDLFLYLHFMDPHDPYRNHESGESFAAPQSGSPEAAAADVPALRAAYASEVRHLDETLTWLIDEIHRLRPIDLIVLTADHGEEFGEHGGFGHGPTVYTEVAQVPLWIAGRQAAPVAALDEATASAPVSLTGLGELLLDPDGWSAARARAPESAASTESFVHGPPRFARFDARHWFASSRWIGEAPPPETAIEAWLRQRGDLARVRQPQADDDSAERRASWSELPDDFWLDLARQLGAAGPGRWTFARGAGAHEAVTGFYRGGVDRRAWCWGDCDPAASSPSAAQGPASSSRQPTAGADADPPELAEPVLLLFDASTGAGAEEGAAEAFEHRPEQQRWVLERPPERLPSTGAVRWREPDRDPVYAAGVEETMQRLRKLGYVTD
ncbi:MAG: hypothetical protein DWQ30_16640 [Acidobacteria bacterium]|nr:MAG: hypothetical protein DWQ30_16640 [Acidobacteriota bacterium]